MSISTTKRMKEYLEQAIKEDKWNVIITVEDSGELECLTFGNGISDEEVLKVLLENLRKEEESEVKKN